MHFLAEIESKGLIVTKEELTKHSGLLMEIQTELARLGYYPAAMIDGLWGQRSEIAIGSFCAATHLDNWQTGKFGPTFAKTLKETKAPEIDIAPEVVAAIVNAPEINVRLQLPLLVRALKEQHIYSKPCLVGAIATVGTEVPKFLPIRELGDRNYFTKHYEGRHDLGNSQPGDGAKFCGRGLIQLTGRANYRFYGKALGLNLENNPDQALTAETSARIFALYFKNRKIHDCCIAGDWRAVRKRVNGGYNGWDRFSGLVQGLLRHCK